MCAGMETSHTNVPWNLRRSQCKILSPHFVEKETWNQINYIILPFDQEVSGRDRKSVPSLLCQEMP